MIVGIETSSYTPLLMNTPNTIGLLELLQRTDSHNELEIIIHKDSIEEALLQFQQMRSDWSENPAYRARWLAKNLSESELSCFKFPGDAFRILIGGNIGPPFFGYLNYTRLCGFLYASLIDELDFSQKPKMVLLKLADAIDQTRNEIVKQMRRHLVSGRFKLNTSERYTCWGPFYMRDDLEFQLEIKVFEDTQLDKLRLEQREIDFGNLRKFDEQGKRDAYHYAMMLTVEQKPSFLVVADSGFRNQVKKHLGSAIAKLIQIRRGKTHRPDRMK